MKIMVTGISGRLGRATRAALAAAGHDVAGIDVCFSRDVPKLHLVDLLDGKALYPILDGCDAVVHLANHTGVHHGPSPQAVYGENNQMNANVFQAAFDLGIRRFVFASSIQAVCGDRDGWSGGKERPSKLAYLPLDEHTPRCPGNLYALSKVAGEMLLEHYAAQDAKVCATAIRFPVLISRHHIPYYQAGARKRRHIADLLDEAFTYLVSDDGGALIEAVLRRETPGCRCILPAAPDNLLGLPIPEVIREYYPTVPLRAPAESLTSFVDLAALERRYGWTPKHGGHFTPEALAAVATED